MENKEEVDPVSAISEMDQEEPEEVAKENVNVEQEVTRTPTERSRSMKENRAADRERMERNAMALKISRISLLDSRLELEQAIRLIAR